MPEQNEQLKLNDEARTKLGRELMEKITPARSAMSGLFDKITVWKAFYENDLPEKNFPWDDCSNVNVPATAWVVNSWLARLTNTILGVNPYTLAVPPAGSGAEGKQAAGIVERFLYSVQTQLMHLRVVCEETFLETLLSSTGIWKVAWKECYRTVKKPVDVPQPVTDEFGQTIGMQMAQEIQEVQEPKYAGPDVQLVDLRNFVIYPLTARTVDDAYLIGDKFRLSPDEIKKEISYGTFVKEWTEPLLESLSNELGSPEHSDDDTTLDYEGLERTDFDELWFWQVIVGYDYNGDGLNEDCLITIEASTSTIVMAKPFPYWHGRRNYIPLKAMIRPRRFLGMSLAGVCEATQRELNTIHNQRADAITLALCKFYKLMKSSGLNPDDVDVYPGAVVPLNNPDELIEADVNPIVPGVDLEQMSRDYLERLVNINDNSLGRQSEGDKTASEVGIVNAEAGIRFGDVIDRMQEPMIELARQICWLCYQFMSDEDIARYAGEPIPRDLLIMPVDWMPHGNTATANKVQQRQEAMAIYDKLMENPIVQMDPLHLYKITEDLLVAFDRDNIDEYIGTQEQLQQQVMMQQQMAAEQQAMAQQQMMADQQGQQQTQDRQFEAQNRQNDASNALQNRKLDIEEAKAMAAMGKQQKGE